MLPVKPALMGSLLCLTSIILSAHAAEPEPATVLYSSGGISVEAPLDATQLELRLMGPSRRLLFEQRSTGERIDWVLPGGSADGDYRYEAVAVVPDVDGGVRQSVRAGGFEVRNGLLVPPPEPVTEAEMEQRMRDARR